MTDTEIAALIAAVDAWDARYAPPAEPCPADDGRIGRASATGTRPKPGEW
jgi:hypothetical protein